MFDSNYLQQKRKATSHQMIGAFFIAISNHMNNQAFQIGDVVTQRKVNDFKPYSYPDMRVVEKIPPNYLLCKWYNKNWGEWEKTLFKPSELVKK